MSEVPGPNLGIFPTYVWTESGLALVTTEVTGIPLTLSNLRHQAAMRRVVINQEAGASCTFWLNSAEISGNVFNQFMANLADALRQQPGKSNLVLQAELVSTGQHNQLVIHVQRSELPR